MKRLMLNKRCRSRCWIWGRGLAMNRWMMEHDWIRFDQALKVQSWIIDQIHQEYKWACRVQLQALETSFLIGELAATDEHLEYFYDLRALYVEGRYDTLLIQLDQLEFRPISEVNEKSAMSLLENL